MQEAIKSFMESFPLKTFLDHVIIVNTWANPYDESYNDYMQENHESFIETLLKSQNLKK